MRPRYTAGMTAVILAISVIAPLLPVVMFPTRFIGRGVGGTILGAGLLVGAMMLIYFSIAAMTGVSAPDTPAATAQADQSDADLSALANLLGG